MTVFRKITNQVLNAELQFQVAKSAGPGGQNVNKVNSKILLRFNIPNSQLLDEPEKEILLDKLASKLDGEGNLVIHTQQNRSQLQNKQLAIKKFYDLLHIAFQKKKRRIATRPGKNVIEKRLKEKKAQAQKKKSRKRLD